MPPNRPKRENPPLSLIKSYSNYRLINKKSPSSYDKLRRKRLIWPLMMPPTNQTKTQILNDNTNGKRNNSSARLTTILTISTLPNFKKSTKTNSSPTSASKRWNFICPKRAYHKMEIWMISYSIRASPTHLPKTKTLYYSIFHVNFV